MTRVWTLALGLLLVGAVAHAADPPYYVKQRTWHETLLASREALASQKTAAPRTPLPDFGRTEFTVMAWVRTTAGGTIFAKAPAQGKWAPQGKAFFIRDGKLCYDVGMVGCVTSTRTLADGRWHHVAVVRDGTLRLYIDGQPDTVGDLAFGPDGRGHVAKIGYASPNFPEGFNGDLDDVRVYARALPAAAIRAHFEKPQPARADALVACWSFDTGGADASGNGNDVVVDPQRLVAGRVGKAVRLDGRQSLRVPDGGTDLRDTLWAFVRRDFPDQASVREMDWEREDGIWDADASRGGCAALAARYARACHRAPSLAAEARQAAAGVTDRAGLERVRAIYHRSRRVAEALARAGDLNLGALCAAVAHLVRTCGDDYPNGRSFLARIDAAAEALARSVGQGGEASADLAKTVEEIERLRRAALVAENPLLGVEKLLFVKRQTYQSNHYYTDFINGCRYFGGNLCTLSLGDGKVTDLVPSMKDGIFGRFDLSFDGTRVVFDWKQNEEVGFRLWEVGVDGKGLRQLTFPPPDEAARIRKYRNPLTMWQGFPLRYYHYTDDMQPCYLPDGGICFISTRCEFGTLCDGPDVFTTTVLYRMDADGKHIEKLTNSSVSEASPSVMNDGRILYTRWEYVDKGAVSVKCLWAMYPDGTRSVEIYGNDIALPPTMLHGRNIPGQNHLFVMLGTPHCPQSGVGTVIRVDTTRNIRTRDPMTYITPTVDVRAEGGFHHLLDGKWQHSQNGPLFADPYPLSETFFLVSHNPDKNWKDPKAWGLYLLDEFGNRVRIHDDPGTSCWQPVPLRPRSRPPVLESPQDLETARKGLATVAVQDVYRGLVGVERGSIKYIRINEQVPRPWSARRYWDGDCYDQQHAAISKNAHLGLKVQHGVVPVEADGSAHFVVPADKNIFLQVLDADFMEVQRERTYVNYRPGETRTCVGCHELPNDPPPSSFATPLALQRPPSRPGPQPGEETGARPLHYPTDVQPVLDKHCVTCHSGAQPKGGLDLTAAPTAFFCRSYENLLARRMLPIIGENHPKTGNVHYLPAKSLGSHAGKLIAHLKKGHSGVTLTQAEWVRLTTWVDSNGQYYGSYYGRRNLQHKDHPNFRPVPTLASALGTCPLPDEKR